MPISPNLIKIIKVTIGDGQEVIYEISFGTIVFDLESPGEVKSRSGIFHAEGDGRNLETLADTAKLIANDG